MNARGGTIRDRYSCKRFWYYKPVPARHPPALVDMRDSGNNGDVCTIRSDYSARRKLVPGAAWSVRRDRDVVAPLQRARQPYQRATCSAGSRSANQRVAHPFEYPRDYLAIAVFTDKHSNPLVSMKPEQRKHFSVPESEKNRLPLRPERRRYLITDSPIAPRCCKNSDSAGARDCSGPVTYRKLTSSARVFHFASSLAICATRRAAPGVPSFPRTSASPSRTRARSELDGSRSCVISTAIFSGTISS